MREAIFGTALSAGLMAAQALAQTGGSTTSPAAPVTDASFVRQAAISDMYEIQASQLAQTKATNADVKTFASKMVTDHTKTTDQLKSIVKSTSGLTIPSSMDARHKMLLSRLRSASGANFDMLYAHQQLQAHQQAVLLFTGESQNAKDADLKKFVSDALPTLQQHLSMAQQLPKGGAKP